MSAHPHAANMLAYAQDAAETDKPWERWEYLDNPGGWTAHSSHPVWNRAIKYRRKPKQLEGWVNVFTDNSTELYLDARTAQSEAEEYGVIHYRRIAVHMREVTE